MVFSISETESSGPSTISVSEIVTRHIRRLASSASEFLGKNVNAAVITVPTDFAEEQKEALSRAAKKAGVEVLQYISEPVAALLAYDARPETKLEDKVVVVADLGGTRSDVVVIASRGGMYTVLSTCHDYESGGVQLDQVLIDHFAKEFIKKHKTDPRQNPRSLAKLKLEAEATKRALSLGGNASLSVESLVDGIDFSSTINRTRYELLSSKIFSGFTRLIEEAVQKAQLDVLDINEVCLANLPLPGILPHYLNLLAYRSFSLAGLLTLPASPLYSAASFRQPPLSSPHQPPPPPSPPHPLPLEELPFKLRSSKNLTPTTLHNRPTPWLPSPLIYSKRSASCSSAKMFEEAYSRR